MRKHHWKKLGTILVLGIAGGTGIGQDDIRQTIIETQKRGDDGILNLGPGKMYSQLVEFRYEPSQRDPFISSEVLTPYVTEDQLEVVPDVNAEQIEKAITEIENTLKKKIEINGVSSGKIGVNYAIGNEGQIIRPGEYLFVPMEAESQGAIEAATQAAVDAGAKLEGKIRGMIYKNTIMVEVRDIKERTVIFINPVRDGQTMEVQFEKGIDIEKRPTPGENPEIPEI